MPIVAAIGVKSSSRIPAMIKEREEEAVQEAVQESEEKAIKENEDEDIEETEPEEPEDVEPVIERIRKRPALFRLFNRKD